MGKLFNKSRSFDRRKALTQEQVRALFQAVTDGPVRDRLILALIYRCAMRTQEVCDLPSDAVDLQRWEITVTGAKHGLTRTYTIDRDLRPHFRAWDKERDGSALTYFTGRQGPLRRIRVWQIFREAADTAGIERGSAPPPARKGERRGDGSRGLGVHSLRHAAAMHALDAGLTSDDLRDLLRHKDLTSTTPYADLSTRRRNNYLKRLADSDAVVKVGR